MFDVYDYIAYNNPDAVWDICSSYGYDMGGVDINQAGECARNLVANQGEQAFFDLMEYHPDKTFFVETYSPGNPNMNRPQTIMDSLRSIAQYKGADGSGAMAGQHNNHTGLVLLGIGIVIIAIIASKH